MRAIIGLGLLGTLWLAGCASKPQYPVYMQEGTAPMPGEVQAQVQPQPYADTDGVTGIGTQGAITSSDLPPPPGSSVPPPPPPPAGEAQGLKAGYAYVLQAGDTLFGVSRRFGVPIRNIYQLNGLAADSVTRPGQKILLPETATDKGVEERARGTGLERLSVAVAAAPERPAPAPKPTPAQVAAPAAPAPQPAKPAATGAFPNQAEIVRRGKGRFVWPYKGQVLVPFGQLATNVRNDGINIGGPEGAPVVSSAAGSVIYVGDQMKELGNTIYIKHDDGFYSGYLHLASIKVKTGQKVAQGETIGTLGRTGAVDKPQLHFEIRYTPSTDIAKPVDPTLLLP